jgi:hypothetical protein
MSWDEQVFANWAWLLANWLYRVRILMMVQNVQMKKRNRTRNGDKSNYIHRISNFKGRFDKSDYWLIGLIGGRSFGIVCQETAGRFYDIPNPSIENAYLKKNE